MLSRCFLNLNKLQLWIWPSSVMPEGEKHWGGGPAVIGADNLPSPGSNRVNWSAKYLAPLAPPVPASLILIMYFEEFTWMSDVGRQEKYGNFSRYVDDQEMILAFSNNRVPKFINSVISIGNVSIRKKNLSSVFINIDILNVINSKFATWDFLISSYNFQHFWTIQTHPLRISDLTPSLDFN